MGAVTGRGVLILAVALVVGVTGCFTVPEAPAHEIDFDGTVERTNGSFRMDGQVEVDSGAAPTQNFSGVSVVLYESPGTVVERRRLGEMSTDSSVAPRRRTVELSSDSTPEYVLVESPGFWDGDGLAGNLGGVIAFRWNGEQYEQYWVTSKGERFSE